MRVGIDWVSAAIFVSAYVFSQIRAVPLGVRYGALAAACGAIAVYRLRMGAVGLNMAFVIIAAVLAVFYVFKAIRAGQRHSRE